VTAMNTKRLLFFVCTVISLVVPNLLEGASTSYPQRFQFAIYEGEVSSKQEDGTLIGLKLKIWTKGKLFKKEEDRGEFTFFLWNPSSMKKPIASVTSRPHANESGYEEIVVEFTGLDLLVPKGKRSFVITLNDSEKDRLKMPNRASQAIVAVKGLPKMEVSGMPIRDIRTVDK